MAFRGYFDNTLDVKNRLTIPAKLRHLLAEGVVVALQRDEKRCIAIWSTPDYNAHLTSMLDALNPLSPDYARLERFSNAYASEVELDSAGRVMLPAKLLELAGLDREVAVIGAGNRLEVWDRAAWGEHGEDLRDSAQNIGPGTANGHTA